MNVEPDNVKRILGDRELFICTILIEDPPPPNGQNPQALNIPAFVKDWQTAADKAKDFIAAFSNTPEHKQIIAELRGRGVSTEPKLKLRSIMAGGTILT